MDASLALGFLRRPYLKHFITVLIFPLNLRVRKCYVHFSSVNLTFDI